jgi:hypothetical protein
VPEVEVDYLKLEWNRIEIEGRAYLEFFFREGTFNAGPIERIAATKDALEERVKVLENVIAKIQAEGSIYTERLERIKGTEIRRTKLYITALKQMKMQSEQLGQLVLGK